MPCKKRSKSRSKGRKILNPETNRMVLARGKIGKQIREGGTSGLVKEIEEVETVLLEEPVIAAKVAVATVVEAADGATSLKPGKVMNSVTKAGAVALSLLGSAAKKVANLGKGALNKVINPITKFGEEGLNSGERRVLKALKNKSETKDSIAETGTMVAEMTTALAKSVIETGKEVISAPFEVYDGIVYGKPKFDGGKLKGGNTIDWEKFHNYENKTYLNKLVSEDC